PPLNDQYCPNANVTRGQMAAFLTRALNLPPQDTDTFTDDDGSVFEANIEALATAGITKGCNPPTNDRYCPDANVTRGQMAAFLYRALTP
ncbi:MAG: S-layer homology domain-containing protein, partial [Propionibacteriaceae bacterium]|nr:S-layer homology domain-containing protein [Propionibacteriaceae bacterium]